MSCEHRSLDAARIFHYATLDSTQKEGFRLLRRGTRMPFWCIADTQKQGKGTRNRSWSSPPGNLHASFFWSPPQGTPDPVLSLVAGVAAFDAITEALEQFGVDEDALTLKWPNDVLVGKRKVAGILIETYTTENRSTLFATDSGNDPVESDRNFPKTGVRCVAFGFGVNCKHHPEHTPLRAIHLQSLAAPITADVVFRALAKQLARWLRNRMSSGAGVIRSAWSQKAQPFLASPLWLDDSGSRIAGSATGINADGALQFQPTNGPMRLLYTGSLRFRTSDDLRKRISGDPLTDCTRT